jgi:hypothetical protein|tara:strand:+ start:48 stop:593 length:546 start_codon:yes stop_codon:yes gene_type:complete
MAQIISYPTASAANTDFLLGVQKTTSSAQPNPTKKFSVNSVVEAGTGITTTTVTVSNAEWLALNASPKTLIPAPGANKAIKVTELSVFFDYGTTNFTFAGSIIVEINSGGSAQLGSVPSLDSPLAADTIYSLPVTAGASNGIKLATNTALILSTSGGGGATGGDGKVKVKISYRILDTANF